MKRLLAILCTLALMLSALSPAVFAAENSSLQAAMDDDSSEIIVLEEDTSNLTVDRDTYLDLNGHDLTGVSVTGGTLYIRDSATADYTVADGVYGHVTDVTGNVKAAEGYLQVGDSFHAVNLDIYAMTLRASDVGVYYKSNFAADEVVAAQVESFGVALSVVTAPNADDLDTYCGYSVFTGFEAGEGANATGTSTLLKGIMKAANGDNKNAKNAAMPIYGSAYIKTAEGYVFGETVKRSLQEQVEAIDGVWDSLTDSQKAPVLGMLESYTAVMESWNIPNIRGIQVPGADEEIQIPVNVTAENGIVTEAVTVEQDGVSVTVPAGVKLAEGATALTLTVTPVEAEDTGLTLKDDRVLIPMDVHVEGVAADNAQPLTIYLGKIMPENLNMGNYTVYHVENGNANEMTLIPVDAEFTAHNQYKYSLDGELTLYMASFSVVAAEVDANNAWNGTRDYSWYNTADTTLYIRNADQLAGFGAIVGGMATKANDPMLEADIAEDSFAGKKVVLTADISIGDAVSDNGKVFYPIGYYNDYGGYTRVSGVAVNSWFKPFCGTFDGNGNTISDFYQNTWEMFGDYNDGYSGTPNYYREGMGLFGKVYGGTVRNLNVRNFSCDSEHGTSGTIASYADCGATFENIAIFDCNPRVYNIGNGGIVGCAGWYATETAVEKVTFRNITVDNSNKISALWDASGTSAGGILGQYYPTSGQSSASYPANPGVHFENCRISAILEVNNDCISNYHYYWYRYTGMLMGSVRANKIVDGYTMADTTGITAEGCEVSYGYWNEFWYCELVKNSIASYTHDYQFGRLTSITDLSEIQDEEGKWCKEGNFALLDANRNCEDCYHIFKNSEGKLYRHFHNEPDETNPNIYESFDLDGNGKLDDLKEDRQRYLLPFNQILTGDGMGVLANREFTGVTVVDKDDEGIRSSQEKFTAPESYTTVNGELKLSELFAAKEGVAISAGSVQAYISPVGEDSTVKPAACVISDGDWKNGTLKIEGLGKAKITITDYWYCTPTAVTVNVMPVAKVGEDEYALLQDALDAVEDGGTVTLLTDVTAYEYLDIHTPNLGETERSFTLDLDEHTITPAADYDYEWYPMIFVGINQTVTIKDGTIVPNEYVAVGAYGSVTLENVDIVRESEGEEVVCVWNWSESDKYYEDCPYHITGSATINGGKIVGGVIVEGPLTLNETADIDKLYLNTKTGYGKFILPDGYGLVNKGDYYADLHKHDTDGAEGACTVCGLAFYYVETDLSQIDSTDTVVITMTKDGTTWALTNDNGTGSAPDATEVTITGDKISGEVQSNLLWNISNIAGNLTIYQKGNADTWLYCNKDNDGLRVGDTTQSINHNEFKISDEGYLYNVSQGRYVGVYMTNPDWRCYTSVNSNIEGQTLKFYVLRSNCQHSDEGRQENRERIEATCTVAGREAGLYCLNCDTYIENGALINATGHTYGDYVTVKEPTCTRDGKEARYCSVCNNVNTRKIDALGHNFVDGKCSCGAEVETVTITFSVNGETTSKTVEMGATVQLGELGIAVEAPAGYSFAGWVAEAISEETTTEPVILTEYEAKEATTLYALYSYEEGTGNGGYTLVKNAADLVVGKNVVIVSRDEDADRNAYYALGTYQKNDNREAVVVTKNSDGIILTDNIQVLRLESGATSGTYAFYTGAGYLYAASSTANHLKTQETNNENGVWTITVDSNGTASIIASSSENRNVMQYNSNKGGDPLFSCYASASMRALSIYIEAGGTEIYYTTNVCAHINTTTTTVEATCTEAGSITVTCDDCGEVISTTEVKATGHNYVDGACSVCGEKEPTTEEPVAPITITFDLGDNGKAEHYDNNDKSTTYEETDGDYTLSITDGTYMYTASRDAKGNSCIKLGSSNQVGSFSFTVADDVTSVVIHIAKYKDKTTKIEVNGTTYTLSENSNDGVYDVIEIDTSTTKTVTIATQSDGKRAMVNTIEFIVPAKAN